MRWMAFVVAAVLLWLTNPEIHAIEWTTIETSAHGFPVMRDLATGRRIGDGTFRQWIQNGRLHVTITYIGRGRVIEERVVLRQRPELIQEHWTLTESRNRRPFRRFEVDFQSGRATAMTHEEDTQKTEAETLKVARGRTFAGFGFTMAIKALRRRLIGGEQVTLEAVGFSPKPQVVDVEISYAGRDRVRMATRAIAGDHFIVHPKIPVIARLFVEVPDAHVWLTTPPAGFLRWEGPLVEPDDPLVRVDLLSGEPSGAATPIGTSGRK